MVLSWNEIKERAIAFSKEWQDTMNEDADAKQFLVAFFNVFGVSSKRVASFEHRVKKLDERDGYIDLLWKGNLLVEMKSRGRNLDRAFAQAKEYFPGLKDHELPKYVMVCDFNTFRLYDLENDRIYEFTIDELYKKISLFGFIAGYGATVEYKEQDPVNIRAAEMMGKLHDQLKAIGYDGHSLEVYLVRLKSDFRYSTGIVYNNFPWPESPTHKQVAAIEDRAQKVLDARAAFPESSLADLYDLLLMPPPWFGLTTTSTEPSTPPTAPPP